MTKKNDPYDGAEIDQDSEPLRFEEATSLFDENEKKAEASKKTEKSNSNSDHSAANERGDASSSEQSPVDSQEELEDRDANIFTIGAFLKQMREEKGVSIKIISQHTKISVTNLELLEQDKLDLLPNRAYVKGYVKSYAKTLHLNQNDCLELLDATYGIEPEEKVKQETTIAPQAASSSISSSSSSKSSNEGGDAMGIKIGITIGALAIAAFMLILNNTGDVGEDEQDEEVIEQVVEKEEEKVVPQTIDSSTPLKKETTEEVLQVVPVEPVATPIAKEQLEEIKKEEPVAVATPVPTPEVKPEPTPEPKPEPTPIAEKKKEEKKEEKITFRPLATNLYDDDNSMSQEKINELLPNRYRAATVEGSHNVFINANKGDSWLTYKADDGPIKKFVLKKGRTILIRGKLVRIFLGNLGAVTVFRNNKPLKITSPSGVKSLVFPENEGGQYVIPLFIYNKDGSVQTSEEYLEGQGN